MADDRDRLPHQREEIELTTLPTFRASFSHRPTTRFIEPTGQNVSDSDIHYDFLEMMTCAADLYMQQGVLEMRGLEVGSEELGFPIHARGATSKVTRIKASFTQPSSLSFYDQKKQDRDVVMKKYPAGLFHANGEANNLNMARCFITELKVLTHPSIRNSKEIVTMLGLYWDLSTLVRCPFTYIRSQLIVL